MRRASAVTTEHKAIQSERSNTHISCTQVQWNNVIWLDEKRFKLDGADGQAYYWADKRRNESIFTKNHTGGGGVMM